MNSTHRLLILVVVIVSLALPGLVFASGADERSSGDRAATTAGSIELVDYYGRTVRLDEPAMRVVSLAPGITETVFALGYGDRLVGRTSWCDYPAEAADVTDIGNLTEPDLESIIAAGPDLVIGSTHFSEESLAMMENAGLNVAVFLGPETLDGVYDGVIRPVATVLGDSGAGEALIDSMIETVREAEALVAERQVIPSVYYVVGFGEGGDWTAGGDTFIGKMIEQAGGRNIAADVEGWAFSNEVLVDRNPDLILIPAWADGVFGTSEPYSALTAVEQGNIVIIDENAVVRQGPRLAEGFASLVNAIGTVE